MWECLNIANMVIDHQIWETDKPFFLVDGFFLGKTRGKHLELWFKWVVGVHFFARSPVGLGIRNVKIPSGNSLHSYILKMAHRSS